MIKTRQSEMFIWSIQANQHILSSCFPFLQPSFFFLTFHLFLPIILTVMLSHFNYLFHIMLKSTHSSVLTTYGSYQLLNLVQSYFSALGRNLGSYDDFSNDMFKLSDNTQVLPEDQLFLIHLWGPFFLLPPWSLCPNFPLETIAQLFSSVLMRAQGSSKTYFLNSCPFLMPSFFMNLLHSVLFLSLKKQCSSSQEYFFFNLWK